MPLVDNLNIIGCYAQTELGHGSNVADLETTAILDLKTDEFIIDTPSVKATKVWPGGLGISSTHAVVFARCIVDENDYGVQAFMVQIRSLDDHSALPGVEVGELGTKLGYNSMDNGFLSFSNFRIPRTNLLSRFVNIDMEGNLELKGDPKMLYQIMV